MATSPTQTEAHSRRRYSLENLSAYAGILSLFVALGQWLIPNPFSITYIFIALGLSIVTVIMWSISFIKRQISSSQAETSRIIIAHISAIGYSLSAGILLIVLFFDAHPKTIYSSFEDVPLEISDDVIQWREVVNDTFADNSYAWYTHHWQSELSNGGVSIDRSYRAEIETSNANFGAELWADDISLGDTYYVEAHIQKARGSDSFGYGLMLHYNRSEKSSYYLFLIRNDGLAQIFVQEDGDRRRLYQVQSDAIRPKERNKLSVLSRGSNYTLFVNNVMVADIQDTRIKGGKMGFWGGVAQNEEAIFDIDNLRILTP